MSKLSPAQVDEMAELREQGWSYDRLAARFNITPGAVHYRCLSRGALSPKSSTIGGHHRPPPTSAFGKPVRGFTREDDQQMLELSAEGLTPYHIARRMGRANSSVRVRMLTLGARDELAEAAK